MAIERYIETIMSGTVPLPLVLSQSDIARVVSVRFGISVDYSQLLEFANTDFLFFSGIKESIGVEEVRSFISRIHYVTAAGNTMIVVIDRFDLMTEESANAMLKTLEDGIAGVVFLLQAESFAGLLETILSRVVCVSADDVRLTVQPSDIEFARGMVGFEGESLKRYTASSWNNRSEALIFLEALEQVLSDAGIGGKIYEDLLEAYRGIDATNASPKYLLDGVLMHLARLPRK